MNLFQQIFQWFADPVNWSGADGVPMRFLEHLQYSAIAVLIAAVIAVPIGLATGHTGRGGFAAVSVANFARALPTIGLLFLVVLLAGLSLVPVMVALVAIALPPILVNTHEGVSGVDPQLKDAAKGMGMRGGEVLLKLELPVALPLILLGLRTAAIQVVSTATIAAYVSVGGLGRYLVDGQAVRNFAEVGAGSLLVVILALLVTGLFYVIRLLAVPAGLRR